MRTIQQATNNFKASVSTVPERYKQGVQGADWAGAVSRPETQQNWSAGVAKAASEGRYAKGVARVSNEEWKKMASEKGAASIGQGMLLGAEKYARRFAPILTAMQNAVQGLPPRGTDAMANIDARLKPVVNAAMQAKAQNA